MTDENVTPVDIEPDLPATATTDEAAAVAAALAVHLDDEKRDPDTDTWDGKRFQFAGRIAAVTGTPRHIPRGAPTDDWTAVGRSDRYKR